MSSFEQRNDLQVYLNTDVPFAALTVGVQGAGKSHTLSSIIECCMLPEINWSRDIIRLALPMTTLMFHYDQNPTNVCEASGLIEPADVVKLQWNRLQKSGANDHNGEDGLESRDANAAAARKKNYLPLFRLPVLDRKNLLVLCSPSYYHQRKRYYGDYCEVRPLLFPWESLTAKQIKTLMRIDESGTQLYVAVMLDLLRRYQRENLIPNFADFIRKIESSCSGTQISPLKQRQALLESIILDSDLNAHFRDLGGDLHSCMRSGMLIIADLTDPLLSPDEANGIFEVLLEQFRSINLSIGGGGGGKLVALDEAHKFMSTASQSDGLSGAIVDTVRLMRHEGIRVAISSQNPQVLAPEFLELVSLAIVHKFHSWDWYTYLKAKIPLRVEAAAGASGAEEQTFDVIRCLPPGQALVFAANSAIEGVAATSTIQVSIRPRLTADRGASRVNSKKNFDKASIR